MCKEHGQPIHAATPEVRKKWGLKIWEQGEIFRPGKTQRDRDRRVIRRADDNS